MRDDFSKKTIDTLAKRVGYLCSNPDCRTQTVGPAQSHIGAVIVGVAAHITAAAPGGPRFDASLTAEERRDQSNGIWLCQIHGKQVDSDSGHFTAEMLLSWKQDAEQEAFEAITALNATGDRRAALMAPDDEDRPIIEGLGLSPSDNLQSVTANLLAAAKNDLAALKRMPGWPEHALALDLKMVDRNDTHAFNVSGLAAVIETFNEIVVIAAPGTGKTTTLLQLADTLLEGGISVATYVPLSEWSSRPDSLLQTFTRRRAFQNFREQHFMLLAHSGRLVLILDGWNELDPVSRKRATGEIKSLLRDLPDLRIIVSTRQQALDVPISGPIVKIHALAESQQLEIARALRGSQGEAVLDHAWRTPGLRELVAIPLYLTALISRTSGGSLPTTKEEVLRLFVAEHEQDGDKAEALRKELFGLHNEMLTALAVEATRAASTTISESRARAIIKQAEDRLSTDGQMTSAPQPMTVLDALVSLHMLVRSGAETGGLSFQHQQFQEWYASFEVESLIRAAAGGDRESSTHLKEDVLDIPAWEESILFACERVSRGDEAGSRAVSTAIVEAMAVDPLLAAEMIYRSTARVWDEIKDAIVRFVRKWHTAGKVDRAVHFMISTGRNEFAPEIWRLISDADRNVHLSALRAGRRFRPSVLGDKVEARIAELPEEVRKHIISEIASQSGMEGIELATNLARADSSPKVQASVIEALQFRRADRFVAEILHTASDEVWRLLASKGYAEEIADSTAVKRLRLEQQRLYELETDPMRKIHMLFDAQRHGAASGKEIAALIEAADFPVKDQHARWIIDRAYQHNPDDITSALLHRLEAGRELPFRVESLLQAAGIAIDHGPVVDLVMEPGTRERAAVTAVCIVGPQTVGRLIDNVVAISAKLRAYEQRGDEATRQEYHRLLNWISNTGRASFIQAVLSRSATKEPDEIALLAELLARHGGGESDGALQLTGELHERMVAAVGRWAELLLASPTASRTQLAEVARAIGRLAAPSLVPVLKHMLAEDLARWRRTRDESMAARSRGINIQSDAHMSWALQYRRAFAAIGDGQVVQAMKAYLPDGGFGGFGVDAAIVLKEIWDREQNFPKDTQFKSWPDFSEVKTQRMEREKRGAGGETTPFADVILAVVNDLAKPEAGDDAHRHALGLANIAFSMPYGNKTELISTLLQLPLPLAAKQGLLTILVLAGEIIRADMVLDGIKALLEEATTKRWLLDENQWTLERWLELIPFSDRPGATIDALELLEPPLRVPRRLRRLLSALGQAPADEAELILEQLARTDERFFAEHDWLAALEQRGTASAGRMLLNLISEGTLGGGRGGLETWTLSKKLASGMHAHRAFRAEVYERYMGLSGGLGKAIVERAIAEAADAEGVMILVRGYAAHGKPLDGTLYTAIRHVTVGERPSSNWAGASELFSVSAPELRKNLFGMVYGNAAEARLAAACLTSIDEIRDDYGEAESEPRHPDIKTGRPWPLITDWLP